MRAMDGRANSAVGERAAGQQYVTSLIPFITPPALPLSLGPNHGKGQARQYIYASMTQRSGFLPILVFSLILVLTGCNKEADLLEQPRVLSATGERDTIFVERSKFWENKQQEATVDSIRQYFVFKPKAGETMYVLLENTGGVPLRRDTIKTIDTMYLEHYLRTPAKDTNLYLSIEYPDFRKAPTDVFLYIRNRDSVYREVVFVGR